MLNLHIVLVGGALRASMISYAKFYLQNQESAVYLNDVPASVSLSACTKTRVKPATKLVD